MCTFLVQILFRFQFSSHMDCILWSMFKYILIFFYVHLCIVIVCFQLQFINLLIVILFMYCFNLLKLHFNPSQAKLKNMQFGPYTFHFIQFSPNSLLLIQIHFSCHLNINKSLSIHNFSHQSLYTLIFILFQLFKLVLFPHFHNQALLHKIPTKTYYNSFKSSPHQSHLQIFLAFQCSEVPKRCLLL